MGFSDLATQIIMFIAVITVATGLVIAFNSSVTEASNSMKVKTDSLSLTMRTDVTIDMVSYEEASNTTFVYVRNTGKTMLTTNQTDVYLNGFRIPRNESHRTIEVLEDTDNLNIDIWDPTEQILIKIFSELNDTTTHEITVTTEYNTKDTEQFSI
jgi:archaellum component FlaG (FlaF/FlaG flagellin family)